GNVLVIFNIFLPLKYSHFLVIIFFLISLISTKQLNLKIKEFLHFDNIFSYIIIPGILVISTFDTGYSFDAGYYAIPNQNWLRESNLIIGIVNIFWELGMLSIYEYLSSVLWIDKSFTMLHLLNVYFIHFFYLFIKYNLISRNDQVLRNASIFLLLFSVFDNFGYGGGRNGFIYIEGVTKSDVTVGILFWFLSVVIIKKMIDKNIENYEIVILSLISFFVYEIKISSFFIILFYALFLVITLKDKLFPFKKIVYLNLPVLLLVSIWAGKSLLSTGCFVYPIDFTCPNIFDWYIEGSTKIYETEARFDSKPFNFSTSFYLWLIESGSFEVRRQVFLNFLLSIILLYFYKKLFFEPLSQKKIISIICFIYILLNSLFLFLSGPIPRYFIGTNLIIVSLMGLYSGKHKIITTKFTLYLFIFISFSLLVKSTSYISFLSNNEYRIFDPRNNPEIEFISTSNNWNIPTEDFQCWANLKCDPDGNYVSFKEKSIFRIAYQP
ncbi:MAG: hypothetical protein VW228_03460, partial [Pelagibacteraceae bacterium]